MDTRSMDEPDAVARGLRNLAYRLLGSLTEAEDAVQEGYARWFAQTDAARAAVENPEAWMTTVVSRICFDLLRSARARREQYVGPWIPEPLPVRGEWSEPMLGAAPVDPVDQITLDESVEMAFLVVLDTMTPGERVAFMLHDVFRVPHDEIAEIVGRSPGACRELASSARRKVAAGRPALEAEPGRREVINEFRLAWQAMDVDALVRVLDPSVVAIADGGGRVQASLEPLHGNEHVAASLVHLARLAGGLELLERTVNGQPGLVAVNGEEVLSVYAFDIDGAHIRRIWAIRNPDKLWAWTSWPRPDRS